MSTIYKGYYKCRLCGKEYSDCATGNKNIVDKCMLHIGGVNILEDTVPLGSPDIISTHFCEDGSRGVADFLGFRKE